MILALIVIPYIRVNWETVDSPIGDQQIWSVAVDPARTDTIFAGTRPEGFRSRDGGKTWDKLSMGVNMDCPIGVGQAIESRSAGE